MASVLQQASEAFAAGISAAPTVSPCQATEVEHLQ
jgi:hypothetical protein